MYRSLFLIASLMLHGPSLAAEITVVRAEPYAAEERSKGACNLMLSGPIRHGDDAALAELVASIEEPLLDGTPYWGQVGDGFNLCLSSQGGDFGAGVALAKVMRDKGLASVVKSGDECLSACAIAFFGGTIFVDGYFKLRMAEAGAVIGVHAPSLDLGNPETLVPVSVASGAYVGAIEDIQDLAETLLRQQGTYPGMPVSLFVQMVSTPPDRFYHIETAGQYADWDITLVGSKVEVPLSRTALGTACSSLLSTIEHGDEYSMIADYNPDGDSDGSWLATMVNISRQNDSRARSGEEVWQFADIDAPGLRPTGCRFFIASGTVGISENTVRAAVYWSNLDQEQFFEGVNPLMALPRSTLVTDLAH